MLKDMNFAVQKLSFRRCKCIRKSKVINTDEIENAYSRHHYELDRNLGDEQGSNSPEEQEIQEGDRICSDNEKRRRRRQVKKMMEDKKQRLSANPERRRNEKKDKT